MIEVLKSVDFDEKLDLHRVTVVCCSFDLVASSETAAAPLEPEPNSGQADQDCDAPVTLESGFFARANSNSRFFQFSLRKF